MSRNPATGDSYSDFQTYLQQVTALAAVDKGGQSNEGADTKRKANAGATAAKKAKLAPEGKPGFVPGLSKERRQDLAQKGACFKCGKPGHIAKHCKAPAK